VDACEKDGAAMRIGVSKDMKMQEDRGDTPPGPVPAG
jgi:hypothetical protein